MSTNWKGLWPMRIPCSSMNCFVIVAGSNMCFSAYRDAVMESIAQNVKECPVSEPSSMSDDTLVNSSLTRVRNMSDELLSSRRSGSVIVTSVYDDAKMGCKSTSSGEPALLFVTCLATAEFSARLALTDESITKIDAPTRCMSGFFFPLASITSPHTWSTCTCITSGASPPFRGSQLLRGNGCTVLAPSAMSRGISTCDAPLAVTKGLSKNAS
mmetsp:Transcript_2016/g.5007  ORF Transcript_2016/g.5007 Transcript_2016/m.5007 type:complete len:213 (+) Transcript_2016:916-1554(+)